MAKKQTYRVVTEQGTFTRETARQYAYVVVARGQRKERIRRGNAQDLEATKKNRLYYMEIIAELEQGHNRYPSTPNSVAQEQARLDAADAFIAGGWESELTSRLAQSDAEVASPFDEGNNILDGEHPSERSCRGQAGVIALGLVFGLALLHIVVVGVLREHESGFWRGCHICTISEAVSRFSDFVKTVSIAEGADDVHLDLTSDYRVPLVLREREIAMKIVLRCGSGAWWNHTACIVPILKREASWQRFVKEHAFGITDQLGRQSSAVGEANDHFQRLAWRDLKGDSLNSDISAFSYAHRSVHRHVDANLNSKHEHHDQGKPSGQSGRIPLENRVAHDRFPFLIGGTIVWGICLLSGLWRGLRRDPDVIVYGWLIVAHCALIAGITANYW